MLFFFSMYDVFDNPSTVTFLRADTNFITRPLTANFSYGYTVGPGYEVRQIKKFLAGSKLVTSSVEVLKSDIKINEGKSLWRFGEIPTFLQHSYSLSSDNSHPDDQTNDRLYLAQRLTRASALLSYSTFCFHVTVSQHRSVKYDEIQPVFAADRFSTFTRLDFLTRVCRQFWNGTENS